MARKILKNKKAVTSKAVASTVSKNNLTSLEYKIQTNQSKVSMVLGALIVLVVGILAFNYFSKNDSSLGPAQQTQDDKQLTEDVATDKLPGQYTIKEGDTLFLLAEKYYQDGEKYEELAKANKIADPNIIETGQVLQIPKIEAQATEKTLVAEQTSEKTPSEQTESLGTGGGNATIWGEKIEGSKYTVAEGDWLSKIAGRAYGDIEAFDKIAKANNITDPNLIAPGTVLTIPR